VEATASRRTADAGEAVACDVPLIIE